MESLLLRPHIVGPTSFYGRPYQVQAPQSNGEESLTGYTILLQNQLRDTEKLGFTTRARGLDGPLLQCMTARLMTNSSHNPLPSLTHTYFFPYCCFPEECLKTSAAACQPPSRRFPRGKSRSGPARRRPLPATRPHLGCGPPCGPALPAPRSPLPSAGPERGRPTALPRRSGVPARPRPGRSPRLPPAAGEPRRPRKAGGPAVTDARPPPRPGRSPHVLPFPLLAGELGAAGPVRPQQLLLPRLRRRLASRRHKERPHPGRPRTPLLPRPGPPARPARRHSPPSRQPLAAAPRSDQAAPGLPRQRPPLCGMESAPGERENGDEAVRSRTGLVNTYGREYYPSSTEG